MHNTQWPSCQCKCKQNDRQNPFSSRFNVVSQHKAQIKCSLWAISFLTLCRKKWRTAPPKNCRPTVVYRLLRKSSANSQPTVGRLSADCRPTVGSMSVICWPSVGWEPLSNTRKASAHREEHCISTRNETFSLESTILFRFFRDQSPINLLCLGFLGTKPLTIASHHPRSQEAKNLFTAASCSFFLLLYWIGTLSINLYYWPLTFENVVAPKGAIFVTSKTSLVKALVKFKRQQLPLTAHCAHKRHVTPEAFPADLL